MVEFKTYIANETLQEKWGVSPLPQSIPAYLLSLAAGREATRASDFLGQMTPEQVLEVGKTVIEHQMAHVPRFAQYDLSRTEKYGPQGWVYPLGSDDMIGKIDAYFTRCHHSCKPSDKAFKEMKAFLSNANLKPYTYQQVIQRGIDKTGLTSNSGFPLFTKRNKVLDQTVQLAKSNRDGRLRFPATLGARSIKNKMRLIFMAPADQNLRELSYVYPLMDWLLIHTSAVHGWQGQDVVELAVNNTFDFSGKSTLLSTDFTAMDTTIGPAQVHYISELVCAAFQPQYRDEIRSLLLQIPDQPIVVGALTEPGQAQGQRNTKRLVYILGTHGWISGLGWTNLGETLLQLMLDIDFALAYPVSAAEVNGDDGAKSIDGKHNLEKVAETFSTLAHRYGFESNVSKQFVSHDELHYLQRVYSPETLQSGRIRGAYPLILTLNSAKNPERSQYLTEIERAVRVLMIFNNQCGSPYCDEAFKIMIAGSPIIRDIVWGDEFQAGAESFDYLVGSGERVSSIPGEARFSGLEVVRYLKTHSDLFDRDFTVSGTVIQ